MAKTSSSADQAGALSSLINGASAAQARALAPAGQLVQLHLTALTNAKVAETTRYAALAQRISASQAKLRNPATATAETFVVHGSIVDETGAPRADCSLVVTDAGTAISSKLGPQQANADGYASVVLRAAEFPTIVNGPEPVFVSVLDDRGRQVYAPDDGVAAKANAILTFRVMVPRVAAKAAPAPAAPALKAKKTVAPATAAPKVKKS
jgi:hypothetical protein